MKIFKFKVLLATVVGSEIREFDIEAKDKEDAERKLDKILAHRIYDVRACEDSLAA